MSNTQQPEALNLEEFRAKVTRAAREPLLARIAELEDVADMAIKRIAELEAQLSAIGAGGVEPLRKAAAQGMNAPNEWEDIRTLPTCDDLIWLYCQDSNTIDGPIAPEPNLEEYGWSHWAYANAPSTVWIDAAKAKQGVRP